MNIHTLKQDKSALNLGPFKVEKAYDRKSDAKYSFYLISDSTDKAARKVWGPDPGMREGSSYSLQGVGQKGGLKVTEYQGKQSIDANGCVLANGEGSSDSANAAQHSPEQSAASALSVSAKVEAIGKRAADTTDAYINALTDIGYSREEAMQLAVGSFSLFPLFWFGEKGI